MPAAITNYDQNRHLPDAAVSGTLKRSEFEEGQDARSHCRSMLANSLAILANPGRFHRLGTRAADWIDLDFQLTPRERDREGSPSSGDPR
jgi:hypothetical protein